MSHVFTTPPTLSPTLPPTQLRLVTPRPEAVSTAHPSTSLLRGDALFEAGRLTTPVDASGDARCELPTLADISDIAGAAPETMCRVISAMRRSGMLDPVGPRWVRLGAALLADTQALPEGMTRSRTRGPLAVPAH